MFQAFKGVGRWSHLKSKHKSYSYSTFWKSEKFGHLPTLRGHIRNQSLPPHDCGHGGLDGLDPPGLQGDQDGQEDPHEVLQDGGHEGHGDLQLLQLQSLLLRPLILPPDNQWFAEL